MNELSTDTKPKIPADVRLVLLLFALTRIALTIIGVLSRMFFRSVGRADVFKYHDSTWLDIWSCWDSGWYLHIANHWYDLSVPPTLPSQVDVGQSAIAFFPLYPGLVRIVGVVFGTYLGALIVSNVALILAGVFLYRLVRLRCGSDDAAATSVKYLFLFPTAFILSGIFTESLFLALLIGCFYYAERRNWLVVGILGVLLSLTRSLGALAIIPLAWEYLRSKEFKLRDIRPDVGYLLLVPIGVFLFAVYNQYVTGDFFAFAHVQKHWGRVTVNPIGVLLDYAGAEPQHYVLLPIISTIAIFIVLTAFIRKIGVGYWFLGMYSMLIPLSTVGKWSVLPPMTRFALAVFPLYVLLGLLHTRKHLDMAVTAGLAVLQGFLMVFWANGLPMVV
jgi:hypothetical protein